MCVSLPDSEPQLDMLQESIDAVSSGATSSDDDGFMLSFNSEEYQEDGEFLNLHVTYSVLAWRVLASRHN